MSNGSSELGYVICEDCGKSIKGKDIYWINEAGKEIDESRCLNCHSRKVRSSLRMSIENNRVSEKGYREQTKARNRR